LALVVSGIVLRAHPGRALWVAITGSVALYAPLLQAVLPGTQALWPSSSAAALVARARPDGAPSTGGAAVVVAGYREPSLVFLLGTATRRTTPEEAAAQLAESGTLALVEEKVEPGFQRAIERRGVAIRALGTSNGWNVNEGRRVRLTLYERIGDSPVGRSAWSESAPRGNGSRPLPQQAAHNPVTHRTCFGHAKSVRCGPGARQGRPAAS
jgi:hypothetical protein